MASCYQTLQTDEEPGICLLSIFVFGFKCFIHLNMDMYKKTRDNLHSENNFSDTFFLLKEHKQSIMIVINFLVAE